MSKNKWLIRMMLIISLGLFACAANRSATMTVFHNPDVGMDISPDSLDVPDNYRLGYGDVIDVKFFNNDRYNETVAVRPDGRISLPRVGDIKVEGMCVDELDDIITRTYAEILIDPDVTVIVREFGGQKFYVMGEVEKPGTYSLSKGMSALRAIVTAGGPKKSAKMSSVILIRGSEEQNFIAERLNLEMTDLSSAMSHDKRLQSYDVVFVPRTFIADLNTFMSQFYDVALPPFDVWTRWMWYKSNL